MVKRGQALKVFLDSSVLFSASASPTGGSSKLFTLNNVNLMTSQVVLTEVERNVRKKLQSYHLERYFMLVSKIEIIDQKPDRKLIDEAKKVIVEKDAVILSQAKQSKADILITLDRKHFLTDKVLSFLKPQKPLTPKMFFKSRFI